jgi:hypothetical protein
MILRTNFSDSAGPFTSFDPVGFAIFATYLRDSRFSGGWINLALVSEGKLQL